MKNQQINQRIHQIMVMQVTAPYYPKRAATIKWAKVIGAKGYQIQYAGITDYSFNHKKSKMVKNTKYKIKLPKKSRFDGSYRYRIAHIKL